MKNALFFLVGDGSALAGLSEEKSKANLPAKLVRHQHEGFLLLASALTVVVICYQLYLLMVLKECAIGALAAPSRAVPSPALPRQAGPIHSASGSLPSASNFLHASTCLHRPCRQKPRHSQEERWSMFTS